jgi:hypothetical protein
MTAHDVPAELAEILEEIIPAGSGTGAAHGDERQVDVLTMPERAVVRRYGTAQATKKIGAWLRYLTAHAPQKYNATITRAWTELVGHHVTDDPSVTDFEVFTEQNPALLDKRLLTRHYTAATLASPQARVGWVEPDSAGFPWSPRP